MKTALLLGSTIFAIGVAPILTPFVFWGGVATVAKIEDTRYRNARNEAAAKENTAECINAKTSYKQAVSYNIGDAAHKESLREAANEVCFYSV